MRRRTLLTITSLLLALSIIATGTALAGDSQVSAVAKPGPKGKVVVANRASGTISVIDVSTDQATTVDLPAAASPPEPMYVVYGRRANLVFVGDRANDRVVAFDADDFSVAGTVATGAGVFHMWANPQDQLLWVNNDIDNTATVIDPKKLQVVATVPMPADLVDLGAKPHDVVLDTRYAYVTMLGVATPDNGESDYVVKFDTRTFQEVERAAVGGDPHVSLTLTNHLLYVPTQYENEVTVLDRRTMQAVAHVAIPGAHGAGMVRNGKTFYTTNLPGGGTDAIWAIDTKTNSVIGSAVDTPYAVPHNIALTPHADKMYLTHSGGTSDTVTVYAIDKHDRLPVYAGEVTVGLNPFGLAYVP